MKTKHEVIDNFLSDDDFVRLRDIVINPNTAYFFQPHVNDAHKDNKNDLSIYLTHSVFKQDDEAIYSNLYHHFRKIFWEALNIKSLMRMKLNLYPRTSKIEVHEPHKDYPFSHKGCLFSFNTCDGATILADGTKVKSVANRALLFDPFENHSSTTTTDVKARFNMNVNYF